MERRGFLERHPVLLLAIPIAFGLMAVAGSLATGPVYEATALMEIKSTSRLSPSGGFEEELVEGPDVLVRRVNDTFGSAAGSDAYPRAVVSARRVPGTEYVEINARGAKADELVAVVHGIVARIAREHDERTVREQSELKSWADTTEERLRRAKALQERLSKLLASSVGRGDGDTTARYLAIAALVQSGSQAEVALERESAVLRRILVRNEHERTRLLTPVRTRKRGADRQRLLLVALAVGVGAVAAVAAAIAIDRRGWGTGASGARGPNAAGNE